MKFKTSVVFMSYLFVLQVTSIKLTDLRVPGHAAEHREALLGCQWEMDGDFLYSVNWYKDGKEFYRYVPRNHPPAKYFLTPGVTVDMTRSSSNIVTLTGLTPESAGLYRCEVSGEAPLFATVYDQKYITIHLLPESGPRITGLRDQYQIGERAVLNCSSPPSRPETQLKWFINGQPASRYFLQGPWYRVAMDRPDATETTMQIRFTVTPNHFKDGSLTLKCQSTIAPLYQEEAVLKLLQESPMSSEVEDPPVDSDLRPLRSPDLSIFELTQDEDFSVPLDIFSANAARGNHWTAAFLSIFAFNILTVVLQF